MRIQATEKFGFIFVAWIFSRLKVRGTYLKKSEHIKSKRNMIQASALRVVNVLLNSKRPLSLRELSREAEVPLSLCSRYVNKLER
ncbi:MAG: hypothetical protein ACK4GQ_02295, partial [Candidatus Hadarchaeales archaeon]